MRGCRLGGLENFDRSGQQKAKPNGRKQLKSSAKRTLLTKMKTEWVIDLEQEEVRHREIAFKVTFSGVPGTQSFEGNPRFPPGLTSLDQVRLIRESYEVYEAAYRLAKVQPSPNAKIEKNSKPVIGIKRKKSRLVPSEV